MCDTRLILIEGIPGSGKSTTAGKVKEYFDSVNVPSELYLESDRNNPSDYAWVSILKREDYEQMIKKYYKYEQAIVQYSEEFNGHILIYFQSMRIKTGLVFPDEMMSFLSRYEPYDGKVPAEEFCRMSLKRYVHFAERASTTQEVYIFESSFLQNQVNELLLFNDFSKSRIIEHLKRPAQCLGNLRPILLYLTQPDVHETIMRVADERLSPGKGKYPDWIDHIIQYISVSHYGRIHGLSGLNGAIEYFKRMKEIELEAVESLGIRSFVIRNDYYNSGKGFQLVIEALSNSIDKRT